MVFKPVINIQEIKRDLSIWLKGQIEVEEIISTIMSGKVKHLSSINVTDIYTNKKGERSITTRFTIINEGKSSLEDKDIKKIMTEIQTIIEDQLELKIRK